MARINCLTDAELTAFMLGELPDSAVDEIVEHLEQCPHCEKAAQQLDTLSDPAINALRSPSSLPVDSLSTDAPPLGSIDLPDRIGEYEILSELGRGGMGVVYQARHRTLRRVVALKMLLGGRFADPQYLLRFHSEAEAIARMQHPNIVQIFEIGEHEGQPYFTLEHVEGGSLDLAIDKPYPPRDAAQLTENLAGAVHYAHEQGIVHRDLKPANVLLTPDGQPKITDFGVAKLLEESHVKTMSGLVIGTAEYMAPEQAVAHHEVGPPADIYALGSLLYALLTGRPPFQSASILETLEQVKSQEPVTLRRLQPNLPRDLEVICLKCLQKEPLKRYASAKEVAADLRRFLNGESIRARPVGRTARLWRWSRRNPALAGLIALVAVLMITITGGAVFGMKQAQDRADAEASARAKLEYQLYLTNAALAERECSASNMRRVTQLLDRCPKQFRGWEWHYLKRRTYQEDLILRPQAPGKLQGMAFTPNGSSLAATDRNGTVHLWHLAQPDDPRVFPQLGSRAVSDIQISPDGKTFALANGNEPIVVCSLENGEKLLSLPTEKETTTRVAFSPRKNYLASATWSGRLRISNLRTGKRTHFPGHSKAVTGIAFSPDGHHFASAGNDKTVKIWDRSSRRAVRALHGHNGFVQDIAYSPNGTLLASASTDQTVKIWNVRQGQARFTLQGHIGGVSTVAFSHNGDRLASGGRDRTIKLWNVQTGEEIITLHGHADSVQKLAFSPNGNRLASISLDNTVRVWDATPLQGIPRQETLTLRGHNQSVQCVAFAPNNHSLVSVGLDSTVKIWDPASGDLLHDLKAHKGQSWSVAISPDSQQIASLGGGKVKLWELETGRFLRSLSQHPTWGSSVTFSPNGKAIASASRDGTIMICERNGKLIRTFKAKPVWVNGIAFSPDGQRLATANDASTIEIWDVSTGEKIREIEGHRLTVTGVAFSPNGSQLASGSRDQIVRIWNPETGQLKATLSGHTERVYAVAYSPKGRLLASAGADETVRLWDPATGEEKKVLRGHTDIVTCIAFSADGKWLATGSRDRTIKTWKIALK